MSRLKTYARHVVGNSNPVEDKYDLWIAKYQTQSNAFSWLPASTQRTMNGLEIGKVSYKVGIKEGFYEWVWVLWEQPEKRDLESFAYSLLL